MPDVKIYEDNFTQQASKLYTEIMSDEQIKRGEFYRREYQMLYGEMQNRLETWSDLEKLYRCERDIVDDKAPNSFIPVINPIINGQIASLVEKNVQANVKGRGISDQSFAHTGQILADLIIKECNIKQKIKEGAKNYLLFGTGCFAVSWNPDAFRGGTGAIVGFPEIRVPEINRIFVDGKIKNISDLQKAEWIIEEVGFKSIDWVRREFGEEIADSVIRLNHVYPYDGEVSYDDINATSILYVWTRNNKQGNLQRIVMDKRGMIFDESDPKTPYYDFVNNRYPYFFFGLYKQEGHFHRFGDGLILKPLQETVNKLYDELVTACKFSSQMRTFIDPQGQCDIDQFDNDPSHPIICKDPNSNIKFAPAAGINPVVERLIMMLMNEAQKASRFSSLMSGNTPDEKMTATQAGIQVQQGNSTINDKRMDISDALSEVISYCMGLLMEFWTSAQALRVVEDKDDFEWIDVRQLGEIPVIVPSDKTFKDKWQKNFPNSPISEIPKWMQLEVKNDNGKLETATKSVDFDINITIGEGLPSNKISLYNIILSLAQLQLVDEATGQPMPLLGRQQFKKMAEDLLGLPLEDAQEEARTMQMQMMQNQNGGMVPMNNQRSLNINPNIPGATLNGTSIGGGVGAY